MLADLHFIRPWWFLLLPIIWAAAWILYQKRGSFQTLRAICDPELLDHVGEGAGSERKTWLAVLLAGSLAVLALVGIAWQQLPAPVYDDGHSVVIVLDTSRSMDATDVKPNRLTRAKLKIIDLLKSGKVTQAALVVYAADPYVVSPLTRDAHNIITLIPSISSEIMPSQGSNTGAAILKALSLFKNANAKGDILLLSDGVTPSEKALQAAKAQGVRIHIIGIGTTTGAPIPSRQGMMQDKKGEIVLSKIDRASMQQLSQQAGGVYHDLSADNRDLAATINVPMASKTQKIKDAKIDAWREQGSWLLLPIVLWLLVYFRKTALFAALLPIPFLMLAAPQTAQAQTLERIFLNADQQGAKAFDQEKYDQAAQNFQNPRWRAAAQYRAGQFDQVLKTLAPFNDPEALYNKGNALANLGKIEDAIAAYDAALLQQPDFADALYNKNALENMQKQQQQQKPQQGEQNQEGDQKQNQPQNGKNQQNQSQKNQQNQQNQQSAQDQNQQNQQDKQNKQNQQQGSAKPSQQPKSADKNQSQENRQQQESKSAAEQWLRKIPDRPSNLLRNQFANEFQRNGGHQNQEEQPW